LKEYQEFREKCLELFKLTREYDIPNNKYYDENKEKEFWEKVDRIRKIKADRKLAQFPTG